MSTQPSSAAAQHGNPGGPPSAGHEATDVQIRSVLLFGAGLLLAGIAIHFMVWLLFLYFSAREAIRVPPEYPLASGRVEQLPPEPRLQTNPREDLKLLRMREDEILNGYAWVDKSAGIVRIPIEEAMKATLKHGLPTRQGASHERR